MRKYQENLKTEEGHDLLHDLPISKNFLAIVVKNYAHTDIKNI